MQKAVKAIIKDNQGKSLLLKRNAEAEFSAGMWNFPGGRVEKGESLSEAIVRETKEETGLTVKPSGDCTFTYYYPNNEKEHAIMAVYYFKAALIGGAVSVNHESVAYQWIPKNDWKNIDLVPSARELFEKGVL